MLDGMAFGWLTVFLDFPPDAFGVSWFVKGGTILPAKLSAK